jgi:membrane fusion protein, multidrug efflux system
MSARGFSWAPVGPALLLWMAGCSQGAGGPVAGSSGTVAAGEARRVELHAALEKPWPRTLRVTGETLPSESATLAARVPGQLVAWLVERGDRVAAGQLLVEIDPVEYQLRVAQAQATLAAARSELGLAPSPSADEPPPSSLPVDETPIVREALAAFRQAELDRERAEALRSDGITSARDTVAVRLARLEQQRVGLELALEDQRRARIVAPFAGAVVERRAGLGEILSLGAPLLDLVRFDPLRVRLIIPEQESQGVLVGQAVSVLLDSRGGQPLEGTIKRIAPALDGTNRTLWAELELQNAAGELRPGGFVRAEIEFDREHRALTLPSEALVRFAGTVRAFGVSEGRSVERRLTLGRERPTDAGGSEFEILAGLSVGESVVLKPGNLTQGQLVLVNDATLPAGNTAEQESAAPGGASSSPAAALNANPAGR